MCACLSLLCTAAAWAQPANDNCANAIELVVPLNGFGLDSIASVEVDMTNATVQANEQFAPSIMSSGLTRRSVWFKFAIGSTRSITVNLQQKTSQIQAGNVGFTVYKASSCLPPTNAISQRLTPIETFGKTFHPCVELGEYYIQVSGNNNANGPIFVSLIVADPQNAPFDKPATAQQFPAFGNNWRLATDFEVGCQSIDGPEEICLPGTSFRDFNKSTWHTFTTPAYFDYIAVLLSEAIAPHNAPEYTVGYRLYEGDVRTIPPASLTQVSGCDSFRTNGHYPDRKVYTCHELKPSTTYTIQLIYHKDFVRTMRLCVARDGFQPANGPRPDNSLKASNRLGVLNSSRTGVNNFGRDTLGCNSRHAPGCGPAIPDSFFRSPTSGIRYNHSIFFSFTLATYASVRFWGVGGCQYIRSYVRIFKQSLPNSCTQLDTANIVGAFEYSSTLSCMEPGDYVAQVMFSDSLLPIRNFTHDNLVTSASPLCLRFDLGRPIYLQMTVSSELEGNRFGMRAPGAVDKINTNSAGVMQPLVLNQQYKATQDTFGCANTVLPNDPTLCNYGGHVGKASYRTFTVEDSAILYHDNVGPYEFKVYKGDINLLATAQSKFLPNERIDGLEPISRCAWYSLTNFRNNCVTPGAYTIASFGNNNMLGAFSNHSIIVLPYEKLPQNLLTHSNLKIWAAC